MPAKLGIGALGKHIPMVIRTEEVLDAVGQIPSRASNHQDAKEEIKQQSDSYIIVRPKAIRNRIARYALIVIRRYLGVSAQAVVEIAMQ